MTDGIATDPQVSALRAKLDDPQVAASLTRILDHADLLALLVVGLDGAIQRSEVIGNSLAGSLTDLRAMQSADDYPLRGIDLRELA
ncbi:MAG: hypothetical protein IPH03_01935 [Tetrasphaera sp.]|nr:hypothetical protein [Tetrasphaera sp.]